MIDRCLVAAYDAGLEPLLVLTKADLADPRAVPRRSYAAARRRRTSSPPARTTASTGWTRCASQLRGRVSVLVGHSGVGKSTLVNALVPGALARRSGVVNAVTGRGRHTSTLRACALRAARTTTGWVIDTPGVRSFGLAHVDLDRIIHAFPDLEPGTETARAAARHDEPECALDAWVADGHAGPAGAPAGLAAPAAAGTLPGESGD